MISAFKQIRLSGYNLTPVQDGNSLRLGFGNSGLAYYNEVTGISGYLQGLINNANADVNSINVTGYLGSGNLAMTGLDGVRVTFNTETNTIEINGNSGYFQGLSDQISLDLANTGSNLYTLLNSSGSTLDQKINSLSGALSSTGSSLYSMLTGFSGSLDLNFASDAQLTTTGSTLDTKINNLSGYANASFVAKTSNQVFTTPLTIGLDAYAINYPVPFPFGNTPKIQATLEVDGDVMYNLSIRSIGLTGYTGILSDNILEAGAKIHTFASSQ